jgi:hypothetical protein
VTCGSSYLFEYQAGGGERVGLVLDFFDAPDLVVVNDEMAEFVSAIEPGSCPVVLVGAEHDDGPVVEGERKGVDIVGVQRETDDQDAVLSRVSATFGTGPLGMPNACRTCRAASSSSLSEAARPVTGIRGRRTGGSPGARAVTARSWAM